MLFSAFEALTIILSEGRKWRCGSQLARATTGGRCTAALGGPRAARTGPVQLL